MNTAAKIFACCVVCGCSTAALAQAAASSPPQNVLVLSANGTVEVQQDLMSLNLSTTREGADAAAVQTQLKLALDAALTEARKTSLPGQMDVRTGNFSLYPRNSRDGRINGWQGTAELVLEGRDFSRITRTAGRIQSMTLGGVSFGLSREQRINVEAEAQAIAIDRFSAKAGELAKSFGFSGYALREVAVSSGDQNHSPRPRAMSMEARSASADMPVPVEAGKSTVQVTVSGSVQLR